MIIQNFIDNGYLNYLASCISFYRSKLVLKSMYGIVIYSNVNHISIRGRRGHGVFQYSPEPSYFKQADLNLKL